MKRKKQLLPSISAYLQHDAGFFICILSAFLIGGVFAAVFAFTLPELSCKELLLYMDDFFQNINQSGTDAAALFRASLLLNLENFGILFFLSVMVIGAPFIAVFSAIKGFTHCFTLFFMFRLYGVKTALFFLLGMLPHYLLLVPAYLLASVVCLKFSVASGQEKQDLKKRIFRLILSLLALFVLVTMASLLQAYIEPLLIRLISGLFLQKG